MCRMSLALLPLCLLAQDSGAKVLEVLVPPVPLPMRTVFFQAQAVATRIYEEIGIIVKWGFAAPGAGCSSNPRRIAMKLSWTTRASFHPGALAVAKLFVTGEPCVVVFMDRVEPMSAKNPNTASSLLGHVLAHEIAHVLKQASDHSESGVLKSRWSSEEIRGMRGEPLKFTASDALILRKSIPAPER
jgi:hypothetical protein